MGKKLAIMFPGVRYSCDKPLLYYSKKVLEKNGYQVVGLNYQGLEQEKFFQAFSADAIVQGVPTNRLSKESLLSFVAKAKEIVVKQLEGVDLASFDRIIFVEKSIGAVIGALCAVQLGLEPFHLMLTPIDYAFQFIRKEEGCAFVGTADSLCNYEGLKKTCQERSWNFYSFKDCNHSLETGDIYTDMENMKRFVALVDNTVSELEKSIYDIEVIGRAQQTIPMSQYKGRVLLIVNTATGCGYTPQYQVLEQIYKKYKDQGFEILDFPCNQFANQAPGTAEEIYSFCTARYEISFEQFAKIHVNGEKQSELFEYLKSRRGFAGFDMTKPESQFLVHKLEKENPGYEHTSDIKWNFTKFLVNRQGQVVERFEPTTDLEMIDKEIEALL